jgi:hypothetical protein
VATEHCGMAQKQNANPFFKAFAIFSMLRSATLRFPRSILLM